MQGTRASVASAVYVISAAVDRYKELCEGKYNGEAASIDMALTGGLTGVSHTRRSLCVCPA
jgi:hypothetical protein